MPTGLYTRRQYDSKLDWFKAGNSRNINIENTIMSLYQESRLEFKKIESFHTRHKSSWKLTVSVLMATVITVKQCMKLCAATITSAHVKKPVDLCQIKILKG